MPERDPENIVPLGIEPIPEEPPIPTPMGRAHAWGTLGMAVCAFIGIIGLVLLVTIRWPEETSRLPWAVIIFSILGFIVCAALAAAGAAGANYARRDSSTPSRGETPE